MRVMSAAPPVVELECLGKRFRQDGPPLFKDLNLQLQAGEYLAIMGESGAGKSTLLNLIAGLDRADSGCVRIDGVALGALDDDAVTRLRRRSMGFVFQAFHVLPYLTVQQNVALPLDLLGIDGASRQQRVQQVLDGVGLGAFTARYPRELSGGELQRIAIARALVHRPRLLLADEPTGNLDARTAAQVLALLRQQLQENGASGILITHSQLAAQTADRVLLLEAGGLRALEPDV
jgi:putative ABC transport system ATP-binding protein